MHLDRRERGVQWDSPDPQDQQAAPVPREIPVTMAQQGSPDSQDLLVLPAV